uniref:OAR domain-containing protein n=1 Tax=Ascaris lumbricoides TaxID=6252 RepID=A0A0M3HPM7_ASCLU
MAAHYGILALREAAARNGMQDARRIQQPNSKRITHLVNFPAQQPPLLLSSTQDHHFAITLPLTLNDRN